jgi:hypothetical protein
VWGNIEMGWRAAGGREGMVRLEAAMVDDMGWL